MPSVHFDNYLESAKAHISFESMLIIIVIQPEKCKNLGKWNKLLCHLALYIIQLLQKYLALDLTHFCCFTQYSSCIHASILLIPWYMLGECFLKIIPICQSKTLGNFKYWVYEKCSRWQQERPRIKMEPAVDFLDCPAKCMKKR